MNNSKVVKILFIAMMIALILGVTGFTYGYFGLEIEGTPRDIVMETGDLKLTYIDDTELQLTEAMPGDSVSKKIKVTNNNSKELSYNLYWGELINTIDYFELHVTLECKSYINYGETNQTESGTCGSIYRAVPISDTVTDGNIKKNITIAGNTTHEYTVTVTFDNKTYPQDENIGKKFTGKIGIEQYIEPEEVYCTYDGELTEGAEFVNGIYTYRYKEEANYQYSSSTNYSWYKISEDGWGVTLTNKSSTDAITELPCTYINNKPIVSMRTMYYKSKATSIDLSGINTKNVTNMQYMFASTTSATEIKGLEDFDTSNVTDMSYMFNSTTKATSIDVSGFNTSKVTNFTWMLANTATTMFDLSGFDTKNATTLSYLFYRSKAKAIDTSSFNTSNVVDMSSLYSAAQTAKIDVSNFDTSNVTNMNSMFSSTQVTTLDVSNFDTSNVTNMGNIFSSIREVKSLDVSNFNTSNVTNMDSMFYGCRATEIKGIDKFDTSKVENMGSMLSYTYVNRLDLRNFNTSKVWNMRSMFNGTQAKYIDISSFNTSKVTSMTSMFSSTNIETIKGFENLNTSNVTDMTNMFVSANMKPFNLQNFNTGKVTKVMTMFSNAYGDILDVSSFDMSNVTDFSGMFYQTNFKGIKGLENFNTSKATDMGGMFQETKVEILDLSSFDTSNVTDMYQMFIACKNLKTIYVSDKFNTDKVTNSKGMFSSSTNLVGGAGTIYLDSNPSDKTYARVDGGTSSPGYFTLKSS